MRKFGTGIFAFVIAGLCAAAEWAPLGTLQIASREQLVARLQPVAAKMNFPMLPVLVEGAFQQVELTKAVGTPAKKSDWGVKLFVDLPKLKKLSESDKPERIDEAVALVTVCPVAKGRDAWQKKHPEAKAGADGVFTVDRKPPENMPEEAIPDEMKKGWKEYVAFAPDGKTAFISQDRALAQTVAKKGAPFAAPLAKGFLAFETASDSSAFADVVAILCAEALREAAKETKKETKKETDDDEEESFALLPSPLAARTQPALIRELARQCAGFRLTLGASQTGFDLRVKMTPKAGSELAAPSRPLPAEALAFRNLAQETMFAWVCTTPSLAPDGALDKLLRAYFAEVLKDIGRHYASARAEHAKLPKKKQDAEFLASLDAFAYLVRAAEALRTGDGTCGWLGCTAADDEKEHTRLALSFEGLSRPLAFAEKPPAKRHGVETRVSAAPTRFLCEVVSKDFKPGKKPLDGCFARIVPESAQAKAPLFASVVRIGLGVAEDKPPAMLSVGAFAWRSAADWRLLVRLPFSDLLPLMAGLIQIETEE